MHTLVFDLFKMFSFAIEFKFLLQSPQFKFYKSQSLRLFFTDSHCIAVELRFFNPGLSLVSIIKQEMFYTDKVFEDFEIPNDITRRIVL